MFEGKSQAELVMLTQRESMAVLIAKEPAVFLLEEHVAILQLRAAQLSQDDRWTRNWLRPRKHRRAVASRRLAQAT